MFHYKYIIIRTNFIINIDSFACNRVETNLQIYLSKIKSNCIPLKKPAQTEITSVVFFILFLYRRRDQHWFRSQNFRIWVKSFSWELESRQFWILLLSQNFLQRYKNAWKFKSSNGKRNTKNDEFQQLSPTLQDKWHISVHCEQLIIPAMFDVPF